MSTALTVQDLGREKVELIKQTVAKGASDLELELFLYVCKQTGLDPLTKQIYAIKRWSQNDQKDVMSFQTGIDGLRLIADRTQKYAGSSDAIFEEKDGKPIMAQVTVLKIIGGEKCAFTASARYEEYVQKNRQMQPTSMWAKMPYLMLSKCAESLALRKAFPMELSVLYTNEEMSHLDSDWKDSLDRSPAEIAAQLEEKEKPSVLEPTTAEALSEMARTCHAQPQDNLFDQSSAQAEHEVALSECHNTEELQKAWDECVRDKRLTSESRPKLYELMKRKEKGFRLKK
jgi:phage recombination protein Bet